MQNNVNSGRVTQVDLDEISLLLAGDEQEQKLAIDLIDQQFRRPIIGKIRHQALSMSSEELLETYQEVLLGVWNAARKERYDPDMPLLPFLFTIAQRKAIDWLRKNVREGIREDELIHAVLENIADTKVGAAWRTVASRETCQMMMELMRNEIAKMPSRQRSVAAVVVDAFPKTLSQKEIRDEVVRLTGEDLTVVAVKRALHEARKKIRELLVRHKYMEE